MEISRVQHNQTPQTPQIQTQQNQQSQNQNNTQIQRTNNNNNNNKEVRQDRKQNPDIVQRKREGEQLNIGEEKLIEMIERANKTLLTPPTELQFSIHEKTKQISVKITNTETDEVIREIPPEKVLDMVAKMWELAGLFVDEKA